MRRTRQCGFDLGYARLFFLDEDVDCGNSLFVSFLQLDFYRSRFFRHTFGVDKQCDVKLFIRVKRYISVGIGFGDINFLNDCWFELCGDPG